MTRKFSKGVMSLGENQADIPRRLKRAVIKEELVALTGDFVEAIILNQMIYWTERVRDLDKFLEEERRRCSMDGGTCGVPNQNGWIYKTAADLNDETMLGKSNQTIGRVMDSLVKKGYLEERNNPDHKWDRTKQFRVDFIKIQKDLNSLNYSLEGYPLRIFQNGKCNF